MVEKCKVMHIGHCLSTQYTMSSSTGRNLLEVTDEEKRSQCADIWFTECDVLKILDSLRMDKSPGPD